MVRLRYNLSYSANSKRDGLYYAGEKVELDEATERRLVDSGKAEYVGNAPAVKIENDTKPEKHKKTEKVSQDVPAEPEPASLDKGGDVDLDTASRAQLNDIAADLGIENPDKLPNRKSVIDAINEALA